MSDVSDDEHDDWLADGQIEMSAGDLTFFSGQCVELDRSRLPDPPGVA